MWFIIDIKSKVPPSSLREGNRIVAEHKRTSQFMLCFFSCSPIGINVWKLPYNWFLQIVISFRDEAVMQLNKFLYKGKIFVSLVLTLSGILSLYSSFHKLNTWGRSTEAGLHCRAHKLWSLSDGVTLDSGLKRVSRVLPPINDLQL